MADERFDEMLLGIAQRHEGIEQLLDSIFSFFERRTDLYHVLDGQEGKMGFPKGYAEGMVLNTFRKFQERYDRRTGQQSGTSPPVQPQKVAKNAAPPKATRAPSAPNGTCAAAPQPAPLDNRADAAAGAGDGGSGATQSALSAPSAPSAAAPPEAPPVLTGSTWNGSEVDGKYRWTQSISEVTVEIPLPRRVRKHDLRVTIARTRLKVELKGADGDFTAVLDGELDETVQPPECTWVVVDGTKVEVTLEKITQTWWKSLVQGGPEIDTSKVESVKSVHDYDGETQGHIRKIQFDMNQKAQGKPTSDQIQTAEMMKNAWDSENSPFKGQPYDPALINLQGHLPPDFQLPK